jgi:RND family efflux transporter MFP subunit
MKIHLPLPLLAVALGLGPSALAGAAPAGPQQATAALTVTVIQPRAEQWPVTIAANGNLAPWQEAVIAAETGGLRIVELQADVGAVVRRGQALAQLSQDAVLADLALQQARVAQAQAALSEARANAERARALTSRSTLSEQQTKQYLVAEQSAKANLAAAEAQLRGQQIRLDQTQIRAVDDGVISARSATLGGVVQAGTELFRLVRQNRIEWRAEVTAEELARIQPGQQARVRLPGGDTALGVVRMPAPTFDPATRMALVYVDLPTPSAARAGLYARGEILVGTTHAATVPESAVVLRDGNSYLFTVGADGRVVQHKVSTGRRARDRVEILVGLPANVAVVASGGAFLNDGDTVRVVTTAAEATP